MKPVVRRWLSITCTLAVMMCLTGCWDYKKINARAQVLGIGVDPAEDTPGQLVYTIQVPTYGANPVQVGQTPQSGAKYDNYVTRGFSLAEAIEKAQFQSDKALYLGNLECVVLNQNLSADNVTHVVSEFMSMRAADKLTWLTVTPQSASTILNVQIGDEIPADFIERYYSSTPGAKGYGTHIRLWEFWRRMLSPGVAPYAGIVQVNGNKLVFNGMEVFDKTAPTLTFSDRETMAFNFAKGQVNGVIMQTGGAHQHVDIRDVRSSSRLSASLSGVKPTLHVHVRVKAMLLANRSDQTEGLGDAEMRQQEVRIATEIKTEELAMMKKLQQAQLDALGFGEQEVITQPSTESFVRQHWKRAFSEANLDVTVRVQLIQKGEIY